MINEHGDTEENRQYAWHESQEDQIVSSYEDETAQQENDYSELVSYFNKSAVIVAYALFESELRNLCDVLQSSLEKRVGLRQMLTSSGYFQTMIEYLDLVLEVDTGPLIQSAAKSSG